MTSRERLQAALNHRQPDRVPVDCGGTTVTGMHVSAITRLRKAVLADEAFRVKVTEPYQMLGEIDPALAEALGIDVVGLPPRKTMFGFENARWKPFTLFDGTQCQVSDDFNTTTEPTSGDLLIYPEGDTTVPPSARMPKDGLFFDAIIRQEPIDDDRLDPADNWEEFSLLSEEDKAFYRRRKAELSATGRGVALTIPGAAFGDIALVPAAWMKRPKGIRDIEEWYVSTAIRPDYVLKVFERQCEIALKNIQTLIELLGDTIDAAFVSGTDFGTQRGPFISVQTYRELYKPFHSRVNRLIHQKSNWKTFIHSCGSIYQLIPEFIEAGFDILNPVQCSASEMDPARLKSEFGKQVTFWGGGVDTQQTLPFGTPEQVYREVRRRIEILNDGGGFVFNSIHNIQGNTPIDNILAMFRAVRDSA